MPTYILNRNVTHNGQFMKKGSKCKDPYVNELLKYGYITEDKSAPQPVPPAPKEEEPKEQEEAPKSFMKSAKSK